MAVSEGYKEIDINPRTTSEQIIEVEMEPLPPAEEIKDEQPEPVIEDKKQEPIVKRENKKSRYQERVKELVSKTHEAENRAAQAEARALELEKKLLAGTASTKESLKGQLETAIKSLQDQLILAAQNGDSSQIVTLQNQLIDAKVELKSLANELKLDYKAVEEAKVRSESPKIPAQPAVPEKAQDWIEDHPEFNTDELFHSAALVVNNQLLREGFNATTDEFYEELSQRLSKRFPEVFGVQEKNGVELSNKTDSPEEDKGAKKSSKVRTTEQIVSGSSRPAANAIQKKTVTEVQLSPEDVRQAEIWGMDLKKVAKRIAHKEANTRTDGYVPIMIPKN